MTACSTESVSAYPLTPLQQGMLFHARLQPGSGVDVEQLVCTFTESVDADALERAWEIVSARYPALRTRFAWEGLDEPRQEVLPELALEWVTEDWRGEPREAIEERFQMLLDEDRRRGFDLSRPPLQRFRLVRIDDRESRLLWTFHHAILDGRSFTIVLREVFALYEGADPASLCAAPPEFATFAAWSNARDAAGAGPVWRALLAGFDTPTPLPRNVDVVRGTAERRQGDAERRLSRDATAAVLRLAADAEVTPNTVLQGAWALLLARHAGTPDVVFGATRAGRHAVPRAEEMVGLLINTVPFRVRVAVDAAVREWLAAIRHDWVALRDVEHTPLHLIQSWSDIPAGTALFETLLVFENYLLDTTLRQTGQRGSTRSVRLHEQTNVPLTLAVYGGEELTLKLDYDRARVTDATAARLLEQLAVILGGMAADPAARVADVPWLSERERALVVHDWNRTAREYPRASTIGRRFDEIVRRTPEAVALCGDGFSMTYADLDRRATAVARHLRASGVSGDTPVGLAMPRSAEMIIAALGIVKAGGGYVTLDPDYPRERLALMLTESGARIVVTTGALASHIGTIATDVAVIDAAAAERLGAGSAPLADDTTSDGLAYVIFTSGSTGTPKGVQATHRGVLRLVCNPDYADFGPDDVFLSFAPLSFDASTLEIWGALLNGARLVVAPQSASSLDVLASTVAQHRVTTLWLTAALFHQIVDLHMEALRPLRQLLAGGDVLSVPRVQRVRATYPALRLINGYGPTENTTFTCCHTITDDDVLGAAIPIGRPIANTTAYILDEALRPVPVGARGRLFTGGDGVARGYINRPDLTAERFVADPFSGRDGARMYDTGDLAAWRADGIIEFLGRADGQLKIRGFRIEPAEIEAVLLDHPAVRECVVIGREDAPGDKRLVAYVVAVAERSADVAESLRQSLAARLPAYMVPSSFVFLDTIPVTRSGKVDRRALPAPDLDRNVLSRAFVAPATENERTLASIWSSVLRVDPVGTADNFFELGGDSILMMQVVDRARRAGLVIGLRDFFRHPTVADLAAIAAPTEQSAAGEAGRVGHELGPAALASLGCAAADVEDAYPLSPIQTGLLYQTLSESVAGAYHVQIGFVARGPLDVARFRAAWRDVLGRHQVFRTAFVWEGVPEPRQVVMRDSVLDWTELDQSALSEDEHERALAELLANDRERGFDLSRAPLTRVTLVRGPRERWDVVWSVHHIVIDGWSAHAVLQELRDAYAARVGDPSSRFVPPPSYREFVETLQLAEGAEAFWRERLRGIEAPTTPAIEPPAHAAAGFDVVEHALSDALSESVRRYARGAQLTVNTVFQGAWALLLGVYAGADDVLFGTTVTTRPASIDGADRMVGLFLNTLPTRVRIEHERTAVEWLRALQRQNGEARDFESTPLADVQRWSEFPPATPLFETLFVFENYPDTKPFARPVRDVAFGDIAIREQTHYPLTLLVLPGSRFVLRAMFDASRFDALAVERVLEQLDSVIERMIASADSALGALDLVSGAERRLLESWQGARVDFGHDATVVSLLARQAERTPHAIAVQDESRRLTFAELDRAATAFAHRLRERGVATGTRVGIAAERSVEMVIALVATLKAGGAYVPLDPENPADRLRFMIEDAELAVVVAPAAIAARLPVDAAKVVALDGAADLAGSTAPSLPPPAPDDPAYMIYTSGSTGRPKGAVNSHRGIVNRLMWGQSHFRLGERDTLLQKTPFSFDVSAPEFFLPLVTGARLFMARPGGHRDPEYLADVIEAEGVTVCHFVPSMLRAFLTMVNGGRCASLRDVMASGEALPPALVAAFRESFPSVRLHNLYGPTECAVEVSCWVAEPSSRVPATIPIGQPIANTRLYVLDARGRTVPIGAPGELHIAGVQVGLGYHARPELTAERFVPDPYAPAEYGHAPRMYRTGDRARWRADGTIEYLGRFDFQLKIRGFRIELGEIEATLERFPGVAESVVIARAGTSGEPQLVAYFVPTAPLDIGTLREFVTRTLPPYMVPAAFVALERIPVTSNGKLDRRALPEPALDERRDRQVESPPATATEALLATIWRGVLRVDDIGIHDNFYALGGDSILAIQVAARAREQGLRIGVAMIAKHPTIAALAAVLDAATDVRVVTATRSTGTAPLTPIQRWFFELDPAERNHWNQTFLFRTLRDVDADVLREAIAALLERHDALRLRFTRVESVWQQHFTAESGDIPLWVEDLGAVPDVHLPDAIAAIGERAARSLDIATGPMLRAVWMPLGGARGGRLLLAIHHLVVDGVSWRILLEDLERAYTGIAAGRGAGLPAEVTSYQQWAADLATEAASPVLEAERAYWESLAAQPLARIPVDGYREASNTVGEASTLTVRLDRAETAALLQQVPPVYATQANDVLLTALADAIAAWAGEGELLLDMEGHGREEIAPGTDLTRTVGWFTSVFPVRLPLRAGSDVAARLKHVKELLRQIPRRGIGYGILRYLAEDSALSDAPRAELVFNYLGQFDQLVAGSSLVAFASEPEGSWLSPAGRRRYLIDVNALVLNGELEFRWTFGRNVHAEATIRRVAESMLAALRDIIAHCAAPGAGGRTPTDFPLVSLTQAQVDRLVGDGRDVDDVAPVAPMQALFLAASGGDARLGFEQWRFELQGELDVGAYRRAWESVVARHDILRGSFHADSLDEPVQVIHRTVVLPFTVHDWRAMSSTEREARMASLLAADRAHGMPVGAAPLVRLTLVRTDDARWTFVWSTHHLLLDRWSWPIVLREVGMFYDAIRTGTTPPLSPAPRWSTYLAWLEARDQRETERFWRHELDLVAPSAIPTLAGAGGESGERRLELTVEETTGLRDLARAHGVPLNAIVSAAWSIWLAAASGRDDVVFGVSVTGRPDEIQRIDRLVGMCINNVPVRVRIGEAVDGASLFRAVDVGHRNANEHGYVSLTKLQEWSQLPWHQRLFDTLLVFQHHSAEAESAGWLGDTMYARMLVDELETSYPLALVVGGSDALVFRLAYVGRFAGAEAADAILGELRAVLDALGRGASVADALAVVPTYRRGDVASRAETARSFEAPRDDLEWVVARTWEELLGRAPIGVADDFFELGGQSLVATQVMSRVRDRFQLQLPVSLLFEHPTVDAFARALRARGATPRRVDRVASIIRRVEQMSMDDLREAGTRG